MDDVTALFHDADTHKKIVSSVVIFLLTTVASFLIGRWYGSIKAWREWDKKHFLERVIVSLNNFSDGTLKIRTIFERGLEEVFTTPLAVAKVRLASKQTKEGSPMLPLAKEDRWFLLNFVLNAIAEKFTDGLVRFDARGDLQAVKYLICLTCEAVGEVRIRKVRVMMIREEVLLSLPETVNFESPSQRVRLDTLRHCAEVYRREPDNFLTLEVYV